MKRFVLSLLAVSTVLTLVVMPSSAMAASLNPGILPLGAHPLGASYPDWATGWTQWTLGSPVATNPIVNPDNCGLGDMGHMWFLSAALAPGESTNCTIPEGTMLLVTPAGSFCFNGPGEVLTDAELRACAVAGLAALTDISLTVDGRPVKDPTSYATITPPSKLDVSDDNLFGLPAGSYPIATAADFFVLRPLTPGEHVITAHDTNLSVSSEASFTYHITVGG